MSTQKTLWVAVCFAFLAQPLLAGEDVKDRILEDVKNHRIYSVEGETPEAERPLIQDDRALDPETGEDLEPYILKAEPVAGALKYAAFYSPGRKVYWTFVWGGPRNVRIIHGPFKLSTVTLASVEKALQKLLTPEDGFGFYEGQFKEIVDMGKGTIPLLLQIFRNEARSRGMRTLSIEALGDIKDPSVIPQLRELYTNDDYAQFRDSIIFTLAKLGDMHYANEHIANIKNWMQQNADDKRAQGAGYGALAHAYARLEKQEEAIDCYRKAIAADPENAASHYYNMACAFSVMKRIDEGIEALTKAVENGYDDYDWMMLDGDLNNLRKDSRFEELAKRLKGK